MKRLSTWLACVVLGGCFLAGCSGKDEAGDVAEPAGVEVPDAGAALEGMFSYVADAALFRDCSTGQVFPMAMAGPFAEVKNAYLNSGIEPGMELKIGVHARYLERPELESNSNEIMLVVDSFDGISQTKDCVPTVQAELENTYWKLVELEGLPVTTPDDAREIYMVLAATDARVKGFSGCNNFFGQYRKNGGNLSFSALGSTMMACPEGMDTEQTFLKALGETDRMELNGLFLLLYSSDHPVARLEAVYLP